METTRFDASELLDTPVRRAAYLTAAFETGDPDEVRDALGVVARARGLAEVAREARLSVRHDSDNPPLAELLVLDDAAFRARFRGTPIKRTGRDRFLRNVLIAAGNSGDASLAALVEARLEDTSPLVRAMAVWALARLSPQRFSALRSLHANDPDSDVRSEWMGEAA